MVVSDYSADVEGNSLKANSCMRIVNCLCGVDSKAAALEELEQGPKLTPEEEAAAAAKFLDEDKFWKRFSYFIMIN